MINQLKQQKNGQFMNRLITEEMLRCILANEMQHTYFLIASLDLV